MLATGEPVAARVRDKAECLLVAVRQVLDEVRVAVPSPGAMARTLRVHRTLASRLLNAVRTDDALAAVSRLPRSEGLHLFLNAARERASADAIAAAEVAVSDFDALVRRDLGGWDGLDAAISEWLPEAREKFELVNRQAVFKGMAALYGAQVDVHAITAIYHPDASGQRCDIAVITGLYGLRRLRPGAAIPVTALGPHPRDPRGGGYPVEWLSDGDGADGNLLFRFSSRPAPRLSEARVGQLTQYMLSGDEIGSHSEADLVTAFVTRSLRPLTRAPGSERQVVAVSAGIEVPARALVVHVLLDERVFAGVEPTLAVYDTHVRGVASPNDPLRDADRIETIDRLQFVGSGAPRFRLADVGQHVEQVQYVCARLGWNAAALRGYRCKAPYPLRESQYVIMFDPPARDGAGGH